MATDKRIYRFSEHETDGDASMKALLGGKGANLAEMAKLGMPVPPGFTITTEVCNAYSAMQAQGTPSQEWWNHLLDEIDHHDSWLAAEFKGVRPLISVRSGAPVSMPGMMDTILNVGLTTDNLVEWGDRIGVRAAWDSYRRLIQMLGSTAYGVAHDKFEFQLAKIKKDAGAKEDWELNVTQLQTLVSRYKHVFSENTKKEFPDTRGEQKRAAICAVFESWMNPRAIEYRKIHKIPESMGTAVNVQAMVFGNMGEDSGTGVLFTRNPSSGDKHWLGEFLENAQGEDVVAGIRTPRPIDEMPGLGPSWFDAEMRLNDICIGLEHHYHDMMDIEFTVQQGKLWILQCRTGKRSALAAFKIARQFVDEGRITKAEVFKRLTPEQYKLVRLPRIADGFSVEPHAVGKGACPGVVTGKPVFSSQDAVNCTEPCILVTPETNPDDIAGMAAAVGILTQTGGSTSHAAVVARAMDKPCIVGCTELDISLMHSQSIKAALHKVTIDGTTGRVWMDVDVPLVNGANDPDVQEVCHWALQVSGKAASLAPGSVPNADAPIRIMAADFWGHLGKFEDTLNMIAAAGIAHLVTIDFNAPNMFWADADKELRRVFDDDLLDIDFGNKALELMVGHKGLAGLAVIAPLVPPALAAALALAGFRLGTAPSTVADLLKFDAVVLTPKFVSDVIGGPAALAELQAVFASAQKPIRVIPPAAPLDYVVFELLGAAG